MLFRGRRRRLALTLGLAVMATSAFGQGRLSSTQMSCAQARGLVTNRGAVVLGTGGFTYDRFVANGAFCESVTEVTQAAWVQTADNPQCFVGYRCREPDIEEGR